MPSRVISTGRAEVTFPIPTRSGRWSRPELSESASVASSSSPRISSFASAFGHREAAKFQLESLILAQNER